MVRGTNMPGRFRIDDEIANIRDGMQQDLRMPVGQSVQWWVFNQELTTADVVFDVATDKSPDGRYWDRPFTLPCLSAEVIQGETHHDERGFYNVDRLHLTVSFADIQRLLPDLPNNTDIHLKDRVGFRGALYQPFQIWSRGQVADHYTVVSIDALQVKPDEVVNDPQFAAGLTSAPPQNFKKDPPGAFDPYFATYDMPGES